jgi:DNA repair exonuclease SbcCD ATPase subunit
MRLRGKNFQPWADFDIEISKLTALVGPSNKGKSSIFRALQGVLRNELPSEFVRNEQDAPLEVEIEVDGHTIKAVRSRKGSTKYTIDGKEYAKLAGEVPEVIKALKFGAVEIGEFSADPIFARQNKAQFLIDADVYKPSEINAILGAFSSTERLDAGKKEANLQITQKNSEARTLAVEVRSAEERRGSLGTLVESAEPLLSTLDVIEQKIRHLQNTDTWLDEARSRRSRLQPLKAVVKALSIPDVGQVVTIGQKSTYLQQAASSAYKAKVLSKMDATTESAVSLWSDIVSLARRTRALDDAVDLLEKRTSSSLKPKVEAIIAELEDSLYGAINEQGSIKYIGHVLILRDRVKLKSNELKAVEQQLEAAKTEVQQGICPRCGKPLEHICE